MPDGFVEAKRQSSGLLTGIERRVLIWIAERLPARIHSDHLTGLGFLSMFLVGVCFATWRDVPGALAGVIVFLALNWFGDSLDGTLARVRGHQRPRYGFYVDHVLDTFGILFVISGLAISGDMTPLVAAAFLIAYYILSIEIFLATYCVGRFQMSFWGFGPTELRILLAVGAAMLAVKPMVSVFGVQMRLFDVGGIVGAIGLLVTAIVSAIGNTRRLYEAEPLPKDVPSQRKDGKARSKVTRDNTTGDQEFRRTEEFLQGQTASVRASRFRWPRRLGVSALR